MAGAKIVAHGRHPREEPTHPGRRDLAAAGRALRVSDVVVPCVPLTAETERADRRPRAGADEADRRAGQLLARQGARRARAVRGAGGPARFRAAGPGRLRDDPTAGDNPLLTLDNVLATPHVAGLTADQISGLVENLELFLAGQRPRRLANAQILDRGTAREHICM